MDKFKNGQKTHIKKKWNLAIITKNTITWTIINIQRKLQNHGYKKTINATGRKRT